MTISSNKVVAGTDLDANIDSVEVEQTNHNDLNCNANIQVGDADVSNSNPVPITSSETSQRVLDAVDVIQTYTWLSFGTNDERVSTIVYTSATVGNTVTDTFAYTLVSGSYRLDSITRVVT